MHRCTHNAAGGTIQRLNPGFAIVRVRARNPKRPPEAACAVVSIFPPVAFSLLMLCQFILVVRPACIRLSSYKMKVPTSGFGFRFRGSFKSLQRSADIRIQSGAALRQVREDRGAHAWIPEFLDVLGCAGDALLGALAREEFADLVGHINELLIMRHWSRCLRCFF